MTRRRVVVTGLGIVSPLGSTVASAWDGIPAGRSGIGPITRFDVSAFATRFGGAVEGFNARGISLDERRPQDGHVHALRLRLRAVQAMTDSGLYSHSRRIAERMRC